MSRGRVDFGIDFRNLLAPLHSVHVGQFHDLLITPMQIVSQKGALFVQFILGIESYSAASIKFTGTSTSSPQWGQMHLYLGISMELILS